MRIPVRQRDSVNSVDGLIVTDSTFAKLAAVILLECD